MADIFRFFVYDDRSIQFELAEPIMLEDTNVTQFRFRIPKSINGFDMTDWAWWFVYVNAKREKYSAPLSFTDDEDEPEEYANATYTVDYGMSATAGTVQFALEAINADATTDEVLNEWHTRTYSTRVISTLQGNQTEFEQSEIDIISGMIQDMLAQIREMIEEGGIGAKTTDDIENKSTVSGETATDALSALSDEIASLSGGAPTPASTVSGMVDTTKIYLYTGSESGYTAGHWYYYSGGQWVDGGQYGEAASMSAGVKAALLACFQNVVWEGADGQTYYDALYSALYPPANLVSISATYNQSGTVYDTDTLDVLEQDLLVVAHYDDGTEETVTGYVLSGTLSVGTSTVTVVYSGKTTTFNVTVTEKPRAWYTGVALNLGTVEAGTISKTTGADVESTTQNRTDYIDVEGVHLLSSRNASSKEATGNNATFYFYDADKDFISSKSFTSGNNAVTISTVPEGTKYVRFTAPIDNIGDEATTPYEFMPWAKPTEPCFSGTYSIAKADCSVGGMDTTTGQPGSGTANVSPYIPIYGFDTLSFDKNGTAQTYLYVTLYDVDKNYIGPWKAKPISSFNSTNYPFREVDYVRWYPLGNSDFPATITNTVTAEA